MQIVEPESLLNSRGNLYRTTSLGGIIDQYLQKKIEFDPRTIHLLFAANRSELMPQIRSKLESGKTIIVDRYAFSGTAYSMAKNEEHLDLSWCRNADKGIVKPDLVIYLDSHVEDTSKRSDFGQERYEQADFQLKVRSNFLTLKDDTWKVTYLSSRFIPYNFQLYDASLSKEQIAKLILDDVLDTIEKKSSTPVGTLWSGTKANFA
ncbi:hypothetical protein HDU97_000835 [Phlyctochytrium planicorne]|nr:hypothetical protein HDU97_000835 [Phlyctochytrium planicorne]